MFGKRESLLVFVFYLAFPKKDSLVFLYFFAGS